MTLFSAEANFLPVHMVWAAGYRCVIVVSSTLGDQFSGINHRGFAKKQG
jgi:hypothetical protein